jgi:hypothetical protein
MDADEIKFKEKTWSLLHELFGKLNRENIELPISINKDLRHSKYLLTHMKLYGKEAIEKNVEFIDELEIALLRVKEMLLAFASERGEDFVNLWKEKLAKIANDESNNSSSNTEVVRFVKDLPREKDTGFARITYDKELPVERISDIAENCGVIVEFEENNVIRIRGKKDSVKKALKEIGGVFFKPEES